MKNRSRILCLLIVTLACLVMTTATFAAGKTKVTTKVSPEAELVKFEYSVEEYKHSPKPCLIFAVTVKNLTDKPHRYTSLVILPAENKSAGGVIPRKGNPPSLAPGKVVTEKFVVFYHEMPKEIQVVIDTLD